MQANPLGAHFTHVKIVGIQALEDDPHFLRGNGPLLNVTKLELAMMNPTEQYDATHQISDRALHLLLIYFPNVNELVFNGIYVWFEGESFIQHFRQLTKVTCIGGWTIFMDGIEYRYSTVTEFAFDGCCFLFLNDPDYQQDWSEALAILRDNTRSNYSHEDERNSFLLKDCSQIHRLSIKGATWGLFTQSLPREPIPQEMIMKLVRHHSSLCWLRSDLSAENIAILQQERPEITFVS